MSDPPSPVALVLAPRSQPWSTQPDLDPAVRIVEDLRARGWLVVLRRGSGRRSLVHLLARPPRRVRLVVAVLDGGRSGGLLRWASILARRTTTPLVVVEPVSGLLQSLRRDALTRCTTDRVVSQLVDLSTPGSSGLEMARLSAVGAGNLPTPRDGVAELSLEDLERVVAIHAVAFPRSAMTLLGPRVIERYYRWQFIGDHPAPFAAGAWRAGDLIGFAFGGVRRDAVSGFVRRFLPTIVVGALTHPRGVGHLAWPKVAQVLRLMVQRRGAAAPVGATFERPGPGEGLPAGAAPPSFGVLAIAVLPEAQGSGAATDLMAAAEGAATRSGLASMHLSVDPGNTRAVHFYERSGWKRVPPEGAWSGKMTKQLGLVDSR